VKATAKHEKREANQTDEHKREGIGGVRSTDLVNVAKELAGLTPVSSFILSGLSQ
jgi:hypothetical protein